jgi:hypothetical protein
MKREKEGEKVREEKGMKELGGGRKYKSVL